MRTVFILFINILFLAAFSEKVSAQNIGGRASFEWKNIPLRASLDSLMKYYIESIAYLDKDVEGKIVTVSCRECSFDEVLNTVLEGTSLIWIRQGNQIILKEQDLTGIKKRVTVAGFVVDSISGELIVDASIQLSDSAGQLNNIIMRWCRSNAFGFFSIPRVPSGEFILVVRAIGYEPMRVNIDCKTGQPIHLNIIMKQKEIVLKEVTIEGRQAALAFTRGFTRSVYRRSVPTDQDQYLLDGGRIYNPVHFGGVVSTFNPEVLNDVQLVPGGLPPSFGGRFGGIVDLYMRDGSRQKLSGSLEMGTIGSSLSLEGPLAGNTTFLVSGRRDYPDIALRIFPIEGKKPNRLGSSELITKITHRLSANNRISLSGYIGRDCYSNEVIDKEEKLNNDFSWGNSMLDLRWTGVVTSSLFLNASVVYTKYDMDLRHILYDSSSVYSNAGLSSSYSIEDIAFCAQAESYYNEDHMVRGGVEIIHHKINGYISEFSSQMTAFSINSNSLWESAVYIQDQWRILPRVAAELGGRVTSFMGEKESFSAFDPRFSLLVALNERTNLYGSLSVINQFIHPYRNSGIFLMYPVSFWYPSTEKMRPSTSQQISLGMERSFGNDSYIFSAESYYRITNNLHEFGLDSVLMQTNNLEQLVLLGKGKTYGITCNLRKRTGVLTGSIGYNLSWLYKTFAEINGGSSFVPPFDRRHELQAALSFTLNKNWILNAFCVVMSKQSSMIGPILQSDGKNSGTPPRGGLSTSLSQNGFVDINGSRLPGFQRLELSVIHRFLFNNLPCELLFRLINRYGLLDPFVWRLQQGPDLKTKWNASLQEQNLFPLYPEFEFFLRF